MSEILLPIALVLLASFFQGTFGLGMKNFRPMAWEAWWLVYSVVAMILLPWSWAALAVPHLVDSLAAAPLPAVLVAMLFGFLWGVGGILFGVSVTRIGMSLTYGIVMGLAGSVGSLVPLLSGASGSENRAFPYVIAGVAGMIAGVGIIAWAGVAREGARIHRATDIQGGIRKGKEFRKGLALAALCGVLSALLNVGFAEAAPVAKAAVEQGATTRNSSLAAWVVVLLGAFLMNALYSVVLLVKNRSWASFRGAGNAGAAGWAVLTGVLWFAALGVYGQGAALMGPLGPVIGWPMLLGLALIVSNLWALRAGEWKGAPGPLRLMLAGVAVMIAACAVLGYSNGMQSS